MEQGQYRVFLRGKVIANQDPDKLGRIQVTYPGFGGASGETASAWIRVVQPYASNGNGAWFIPDNGDEVLVAFVGGNFRDPVVLGTLYGPKNKPPSSGKSGDFNDDGKNNLKFLKSRSGNQIVLDDSSGKEGISIKDSEGAELKFEKGKIALGKGGTELFDMLEQLLEVLSQNASTLVSTAVGPGAMNPAVLQKVEELKQKVSQIKGTL